MGASFTPDILRLLRTAGCTFVRHGKGDHDIWFSPITVGADGILTTVSTQD